MTQKELDQIQEKALQQLKSGESLFGSDGAFAPMLKGFIEAALQAEMDAHLDGEQRGKGNKRNGKGCKTIKSSPAVSRSRLHRIAKAALIRSLSKNARPYWPTACKRRLSASTGWA